MHANVRKRSIRAGTMTIVYVFAFSILFVIAQTFFFLPDKFYLLVKYNFLNNLSIGSSVMVAGSIRIGKVVAIYQEDLQTYVRIRIDPKYIGKIPKADDTVFSIFTIGMMGQKYVNINFRPPEPGEPVLEPGDIVEGLSPPSIDQMLLAFTTWSGEGTIDSTFAAVLSDVQRLNSSVNTVYSENEEDLEMLQKLGEESYSEIGVKLTRLIGGLDFLSTEYNALVEKNKVSLDQIIFHLDGISKVLQKLKKLTDSGSGSVGRFLHDPKLNKLSGEAMAEAEVFVRCINDQPWVLLYKDQNCKRR